MTPAAPTAHRPESPSTLSLLDGCGRAWWLRQVARWPVEQGPWAAAGEQLHGHIEHGRQDAHPSVALAMSLLPGDGTWETAWDVPALGMRGRVDWHRWHGDVLRVIDVKTKGSLAAAKRDPLWHGGTSRQLLWYVAGLAHGRRWSHAEVHHLYVSRDATKPGAHLAPPTVVTPAMVAEHVEREQVLLRRAHALRQVHDVHEIPMPPDLAVCTQYGSCDYAVPCSGLVDVPVPVHVTPNAPQEKTSMNAPEKPAVFDASTGLIRALVEPAQLREYLSRNTTLIPWATAALACVPAAPAAPTVHVVRVGSRFLASADGSDATAFGATEEAARDALLVLLGADPVVVAVAPVAPSEPPAPAPTPPAPPAPPAAIQAPVQGPPPAGRLELLQECLLVNTEDATLADAAGVARAFPDSPGSLPERIKAFVAQHGGFSALLVVGANQIPCTCTLPEASGPWTVRVSPEQSWPGKPLKAAVTAAVGALKKASKKKAATPESPDAVL